MVEECNLIPVPRGWICSCETELGGHRDVIPQEFEFTILDNFTSLRLLACPDKYAVVEEQDMGALVFKQVVSKHPVLDEARTAMATIKTLHKYMMGSNR